MRKTKFRVPLGIVPGELTGGQPLEPGTTISLDDEAMKDPHNARLIEEGRLLEVPEAQTGGKAAATKE